MPVCQKQTAKPTSQQSGATQKIREKFKLSRGKLNLQDFMCHSVEAYTATP